MKTLIKLLYILTPREQKLAIVLLTMILIMAFLDMLGVASIMPFIAILTNPDIIRNNILLILQGLFHTDYQKTKHRD